MRTWRKTRQRLRGRNYWSLQAGARGPDRVALALGYVSENEADQALRTLQQEEESLLGTDAYDRVVRLYRGEFKTVASDETGPMKAPIEDARQAARRYLVGDAVIEEVFGVHQVEPMYGNFPLREYVDRFYGPSRAARKPKTWRTEEHDWDLILGSIGHVKLRDVDEFVVDRMLQGLHGKRGAPASPNQKRKARNAISACLTWARRQRHYTKPMPTWFKIEGTGQTRPTEGTHLSLEEVERLLKATKKPMHRAIFASCVGLGLRPNEATVMRWEDIDFKAGEVRVRGTKTAGSAATIPLLPVARPSLEAWWVEEGKPAAGPCYFGERGSWEHLKGHTVPWRKALATAVKKADIKKRTTPYGLRHTAASLLLESGVPMASVAKLLRHSNPRMLQRHYDHSSATRAQGLVEGAPRL